MFLTCVTSSCRTMDRAVKSMEMVEATGRRFHVENSNLGYALLMYGCPGINIKKDEYSESNDDNCDYFSDDDSDGDENEEEENEENEEENEEDSESDSESENDDDMSLEGVAFDGDDLDDSESDNDHHEVDDEVDDLELQEGQEGEDTSDEDNTD